MSKIQLGRHISQQFNEELENLRSKLLHMGGLVEQQVADGLKALTTADAGLGRKVATSDYKINTLEVEIDEEVTQTIALRQPAASDLRVIMTILKTSTDLERVGDEAEKLGRFAEDLLEMDHRVDFFEELEHLGEQVQRILHQSLDAWARMDAEVAMTVAQEEMSVDRRYDSVMRRLITHMMEDPRSIRRILQVIWCARALERIGDHSRNICEYVIYMVEGRDIRHTSLEQAQSALNGSSGEDG